MKWCQHCGYWLKELGKVGSLKQYGCRKCGLKWTDDDWAPEE